MQQTQIAATSVTTSFILLQMLSLGGRRVIITGASSGIGAEIAKTFSAYGATVTAVGRNAAGLDALGEAAKYRIRGDLTGRHLTINIGSKRILV